MNPTTLDLIWLTETGGALAGLTIPDADMVAHRGRVTADFTVRATESA